MADRSPQIVDLPAPRALAVDERRLLDFLLSGPLGQDELRAQAQTAQVVGRCDCGCRSVALKADPESPAARFAPCDLPFSDSTWVPVTEYGRSAIGTEIEVTLHVVDGRLYELEIWDGTWTEGRSRGEMPDPSSLEHAAQR